MKLFANPFAKRKDELEQEIQAHLQMAIRDRKDRGESAEQARRGAMREFGNVALIKDVTRDIWGGSWWETARQDGSYGLRQLRRNPAFALTAIVILALGVATSTAIFAFVDAALLRPLPYRDPSRLVALFESIPLGERYHLSTGDYLDGRHQSRSFTSLDVYEPQSYILDDDQNASIVPAASVSDGFFHTLGVVPQLGRDFRKGEDQRSAPLTAILSYGTWERRYAKDPTIIGRTTSLDGSPYLVIGVLPRDFHFAPLEPAKFWTTLHGDCGDGNPNDRRCHKYYGVARLKNDVSITTAGADLGEIAKRIEALSPDTNRDRGATVMPLAQLILGNVKPVLLALLGGAGLLLLIAMVNVSSLLLVRSEIRHHEIAVRGALGASPTRLLQQFAVEGSLLAFGGCAVGTAADPRCCAFLLRKFRRACCKVFPSCRIFDLVRTSSGSSFRS